MIDIIVCFCDKDCYLIDRFISSINISIDYKLTIIDDREDKSEDLRPFLKDYNYLIPPQKLGTFEARRYGFEHTNNDYVWFVDIDDELLDFKFISSDADVCIYNFNVNSKQETFFCDSIVTYPINEKLFHYGLWNKIYNRSSLKKVYEKLPFIENLCFLDDTYLNKSFFFFAKKVKLDEQIIYNYKCKDRNAYFFKDHQGWVQYLLSKCPEYLRDYFDNLLHS